MFYSKKPHKELCQTYLEDLAEALVLKMAPNLNGPEHIEEKAEQTAAQIKSLTARETPSYFPPNQ